MNKFDEIKNLENKIYSLLEKIKIIKPNLYQDYKNILNNYIIDYLDLGLDYINSNPNYTDILIKNLKDFINLLENYIKKYNIKETMKKSELKQLIKEEISKILKEDAKVLSKEFGGNNDSEFLKIAWHMNISDLEQLLITSIEDLKWLKKNSKGTLGLFNKKDAQWVTDRIKFIKQIISSKKKNPNFIPDIYK